PLHLAAIFGYYHVGEALLNFEADPSRKTTDHATPFYYACEGGHLPFAQLLYNQDISVLDTRGPEGRTPLHVSAANGHLKTLAWLMGEAEADISAVDDLGNSALHYAAMGGQSETIGKLLANGFPANSKNHKGHTFVDTILKQYASERELIEIFGNIADKLQKIGPTPNSEDLRLCVGLILTTVARSQLERRSNGCFMSAVASVFRSHGFDINAKAYDGKNALHEATTWGLSSTVEALISSSEFDVDINC